jgi:ribose 5-phosphate isomerase RpiB
MDIKFVHGTVTFHEDPVLSGMTTISCFDWSTAERIWESNQANILIMAQDIKNPASLETVAFKICLM